MSKDKPLIITETIDEFLARQGKIQKCDKGSNKTTTVSRFIAKDKQLRALKALLKEVENKKGNEYARVQAAIDERYQMLKACN